MKTEENDRRMPLKLKPYFHQREAYRFVLDRFSNGKNGAALLMEMGCGKSLVGVAVAGKLATDGRTRKVLIIAPLSILGVWESEFQKFADFPYEFTILKGTSEKRIQTLKALPKDPLQIVAVNYESAWRIEQALLSFDADLVIADEGHKIKDCRTRQSKCLHHLGDKARYKMLLTGTVITNHESDVFSQYRFMDRTVFGDSFYRFRNRYFDMTGYGNHVPKFRQIMGTDFLTKLHSAAFRTTKDECLDLPEVTEETRFVELEPSAYKIYKDIEKESFAELENSEVSVVNVLTRLLRLSQITGGHVTDDERTTRPISTAKLDALSDIIDSMVADGKKLVIMARFIPELDDIEDLLSRKALDYAVIRGGVSDREEQIGRFQKDQNCKVFVGQLAAAGLGLTLTSASTMVFYSLDYSMANFEQAKARIHRVSQKNKCHYIYLIAKGTVDSKVIKALQSKADLSRVLVDEWRAGKNPFQES